MASLIHATAHGLSVNDPFYFANVLPTDSGIDEATVYYVLTVPTADTFTFSETEGGAAFVLDNAITDGSIVDVDVYSVVDDGNMSPPPDPPVAVDPTVDSVLVSGIVRLQITLNVTPEEKVRLYEVQVTHQYDSNSDPDWSAAVTHSLPEGSTELTIPALGETQYTVRQRVIDVYGNIGDWSAEIDHTTLTGSDSLAAALAALANDVSDGVITETKIADGAISTPKLQAGAVTADILAATLVLASLIKTADSGRRIEIDVDGIRLYDTDESLLVRIPTNGDPVFVKGEINADSLVSQTSAELRTAVSLAGNAVMTLQTGISAPTVVPSLTASVDVLTLTTTPTGSPIGLGYDSGATSFWLGADPDSGYVAHEYNATTGVKIRSIAATGSTETLTDTKGSTSHVADSVVAFSGSTNSHVGTTIEMPTGRGDLTIIKVAVRMAGYLGDCSTRVGIWDTSGNSLRESSTFTATSRTFATGNSDLYNKSLSSPYTVAAGTTIRAGFRRMNTSDGSQWDRDLGGSKITSLANGTTADGTSWSDTAGEKPNVYVTYTYEVDTRLETAPMIGVCTDGTHVFTLDTDGVVWKYLRADGSYVANSAVQTAITGAKSKAGLFYDATAGELIITTATGTGAGVYPKFVRVNKSTLAVSSSVYSAAAGTTFNGTSDSFRGGARLADPLNASAATYWVATTSAVYAYTFSGSTATQTSDRHFGQSTTVGDGLTHDGTQFRGFDAATPTKIWKFSNWDFTTTSTKLWVGYAWYDSAGTTHETVMGPRASLTIRRRERVQVQNAAIPTGGADDPNSVRIYALQNATDSGAGNFKLQVTDALTARYLVTYDSGGAADGGGTPFASGSPAEIKSSTTAWSLKGDGSATFDDITVDGFMLLGDTSFPASPSSGYLFYRTDLKMWFVYDGTRWVCTCPHTQDFTVFDTQPALPLTASANTRWGVSFPIFRGLDILVENQQVFFLVESGGTALGASHKWVGSIFTRPNTVALGTIDIDSGSSNAYRQVSDATDTVVDLTSGDVGLTLGWTKTGTPGALKFSASVDYRFIAT